MNRLLTILFIFFTVFSSKAQYAVCTNASVDLSHFAVSINTSTANANISVMIGENLNTRDFSIGLTDSPSNADVIILDNPIESDLSSHCWSHQTPMASQLRDGRCPRHPKV